MTLNKLRYFYGYCYMNTITVSTPFFIELEFPSAPAIRRIMAVILDMCILMMYMLVVYRFLIIPFDMGAHLNKIVMMISISLLPFLYFPVCEILMNGCTPGKRFMGIKVIDQYGQEPAISQYLLRWLAGFGNYSVFLLPYIIITTALGAVSLLQYSLLAIGLFYFPDFLCVLVSKKNQRFADLAAGTVVIDTRRKSSLQQTIYLELHDQDAAAIFPQVMRLTDKDINGIRNLLADTSTRKSAMNYRHQITAGIRDALGINTDMDDITFLEQLMRDYNRLTRLK